MKMNQKLIALSAAALLAGAACGDDTSSNNGAGNNGGGNNGGVAQPLEHPNADCGEQGDVVVCNISGEIMENMTLTQQDGVIYQIQGPVFVGDDVDETVLTIDPGVTVFADSATDDTFLTIRRNSKIEAVGTKDEPIVFTTSLAEGERGRGTWGGLVINGNAPLNIGTPAEGEGNSGLYGGDDPNDDSGTLKYVRIEFAGDKISETNELNGLALQGVGDATTIDYVQIHMNSDDGVEFFGGTVNAKHMVLTGIGDDSIDWTQGWTGKLQFAVVEQFDDEADRGIEADNLEDGMDNDPRSMPTISNVTLIGGANGDTGMLLRHGTAGNFYNFVIANFAGACLDIDDQATYENAWDADAGELTGDLTMVNSLINGCTDLYKTGDDDDFTPPFTVETWFTSQNGNQATDPMLDGYVPANGSPALAASVQPEGDDFFEDVDFIGAMGSEDWTAGWTIKAAE